MNKRNINFILITPFFILLSHYLAVFPHEYAHSFMAWILGYKINPLDIHFGGTSIGNILLLSHIDENVNYGAIFRSGHQHAVSLIAFAGPGLANGGMFLLSYFLLKNKYIKKYTYLYFFVFLCNLMNLGNLYDYIPIRAFASVDDVHNFVTGLSISPWITFIFFGYIVAFLVRQFFVKALPSAYDHLKLDKLYEKRTLMILTVLILFGFFGGFPYVYFIGESVVGPISYFLSAVSFAAIPGIVALLW